MEAKRKFNLRRRAKLLSWLAWGCLIFFAVFLTTTIIIRNHSDGDWSELGIMIPLLVGLVTPLFGGLILQMFASFNRQELERYKNCIRAYRERKISQQILDAILTGDTDTALKLYNQYKFKSNRQLDDVLYSMMIVQLKNSTDPVLQKRGIHHIEKIKKIFSPDKIDLI